MTAGSSKQFFDRMVEDAQSLGANVLAAVRFTISMVTENASEVLTYGTATVVE
jgi:uncharacterized protein YbjQ (UPF0145 family)